MKRLRNLSKKTKLIILGCLLLAIAGVLIFGHPRNSGSEENMSYESMTATAEVMTIENTISAEGEVKSVLEEKKVPHATYKLKEIKAAKNQALREGDTILVYTNGAKMTAPYNCVVLDWELPSKNGKLTNGHSVTIAGTDVLQMDLEVDENKILQVDKGDKASVKVNAVGGKYKGEVSFVSDVGQYGGGTSTFSVSIVFDNDGKVKLGMNGKAKISLDKAKDVIGVPVDAVYEEDGHSYVSVLRGDAAEEASAEDGGDSMDEEMEEDPGIDLDAAEQVEVKTGLKGDEFIEIKSGLKEGDVVVYEPSEEDWEEGDY